MADNTIDTLSLEIKSNANSAVNSIKRLAEALGKLQSSIGGVDYASFANIGSGIRNMGNAIAQFAANVRTADFTRIATGLNKLAGVNVQGVSDASRAISTLTTNLNGIGTLSFDATGIANLANSIAQLGRKTVTQAADNIPRLTTALSGLVAELNTLGAVNFDAASLSNLVASITKLGGKSATNAIPNIKALGIALKEMMAILSTAPNVSQNLIQMTQALAQLAANGGRVSSASNGLIGGLNGVGSAASRTKKHVFSLAAAFGKFYATYWLVLRGFRLFKKAIDISSDLTEVQNVVDVTFGDMAQKVEDLSKVSIRDFGMSELTTKQISSRYQAMGVAMGFAQDEMSDMSIELTKLAADMASFYNVEQGMVAEKLAAIFTGQTRPLRDFGLDLTQATLQQWALAQGMKVNIKEMSQAEKTLLRYRYVLANTTAAQGDFQRTVGTWANQTRILAQSFEQLGSVIGGALINAFKPLVAWLNRAMLSIISFAQTVVNALGKIFGWTYEIKGGGIANDFEMAGDGAEDMADGTGAAKDNLEKMQKYIAAWHEVNNMTTKDDDAGGGKGGGGGGGLGDLGDATSGQLVRTEGLFEKYKSDIDSLYELGEYIGKVLTDAMNSIDWDKVYEKARNFGKGLADFLNGLISPELFGAVGRTIAGSLNTAIYAALAFGERFDWKDFGLSIATGINEFFKMFDFASLAKTVNIWANGILDAIIKAIDTIDWGMIGTRIGTFFEEIDFLKIAGKVMKTLWKALNAAFETYEGLFETAPLETALLTLVGVTKLLKVNKIQKFIAALKGGITTAINFGKALMGSQTALEALRTGFPRLTKAIEVARKAFGNFRFVLSQSGSFLGAFGEGINTIRSNMTNMQKGITTAVAAFAEFMIVKDSVKDIVTGTGNLAVNLLELGAAAGIAGLAMYTALGPAGIAIAAITALIAALVGVKSALDDIEAESTMNSVGNALRNPGGTPLDQITHEYQNMVNGISDSFDKINQKAEELDATKQHAKETSESIDLIKFAIDNGSSVAEEKIPELRELFNNLLNDSKSIFEQEYDVIMLGISGSLQQSLIDAGYSIEQIVGMMDSLKSSHQQAIDEITQKNAELEQSYANGEISNEEYTTAMMENYTQLAELTGKTDEYADAISGVSEAVSGVDFSQFINEDNTVNTAALADQFHKLSDTANEAKESIYTSSDNLVSALKDYESEAIRLGDSEAATAISDMLSNEAQNVSFSVAEVDNSLLEYGNIVQQGLLEKIPSVVDEALKNYENTSPLYKFFHSQEDFVRAALNEYQTNTIDPAMEQLEGMYSEVGLEGSNWASQAAQDIATALFSLDTGLMDMSVEQQKEALNSKSKELVDGAIAGIPEYAKVKTHEVGKNINLGIAEGMEGSTEEFSKAAKTTADSIDKHLRGELQINSPSERMKPIGMYLLQGIVAGFSNTLGEWTDMVVSWASETFNLFDENINNTIDSAADWFSNLPGMIYDAISPALDYVTSWGESVFSKFDFISNDTISNVANWFSTLPGEVYDEIMNFVHESLPEWKDNIDNFFDRTIPKIIKNVVHLFGDLKASLVPVGENLIKGLWDGIHGLTDWLGTKIGGFCRGVISKFKEGFDEHSPSKEAFKIGDFFTRGLENGMADRFGSVYDDVKGFTDSISSIKMTPLELDLSVPDFNDYKTRNYDMGALQTKIQMEFDEKMAQMAYENQRTQEMMEQIIDAIDRKQLIVGDRDIFEANRRETIRFGNRAQKDPYPIYGRYK